MDVWMVIGRPNVMKLLIPRLPRIGHSYNIQDPLRAASLYNTLLRDGSPVFVQDLRLHATSSNSIHNPPRRNHDPANLSNPAPRPPPLHRLDFSSTAQVEEADPPVQGSLSLFLFLFFFSSFSERENRRRSIFFPLFQNKTGGLELPDNATLIRENIVDNFSCQDRIYGYYADMENDCQIFHVCMPQIRGSTRWSFICPAETVFNQVSKFSLIFFFFFYYTLETINQSIVGKNVRRRSFARKRKTPYRARNLRNSTT